MTLSDAKLRALKPKDRVYRVADGGGLYVQVTPSGGRLWRLAYRYGGKQRTLYLGAYPTMSLLEARDARHAAKKALQAGTEPTKPTPRQRPGNRFQDVAKEWLARNRDSWVPRYAQITERQLERDVYPLIGKTDIAKLTPLDMLEVGQRIEARLAVNTAHRILHICGAVFRHAIITGRAQTDPTSHLKDAMKRRPPSKHHPSLTDSLLPAFLGDLDRYHGEPITRLAISFLLLTFVRAEEGLGARWEEFDLTDKLWRVPADRMKMRRPHVVPLVPQTIRLIEEIREINGGRPILFYSSIAPIRRQVSKTTLIYALYKMGYKQQATIHGFRSTASTILNEQGFNRDWVEMQLAHAQGGVRGHYNAAEYLTGRRQMMTWWADHLDRRRMEGMI